MKISKESHKRMAVVIRGDQYGRQEAQEKTIGRIAPMEEELEAYVQKRVRAASRLYKIFGPVSQTPKAGGKKRPGGSGYPNRFQNPGEDEGQILKEACRYFESFMGKILKFGLEKNLNPEKAAKQAAYEFYRNGRPNSVFDKFQKKNIYISEIHLNLSDTAVHDLVSRCLRGSLRKEVLANPSEGTRVYVPDVMEKLVIAVCRERDYKGYLSSKASENELRACLNVVFQDYTKQKQVKEIAASIEKQDVKVQVFGEGEGCRLKLAGAENKNKKYVYQFIQEYACADEESRKDMLGGLRRLMLLFFCGESAYLEKERLSSVPLWGSDFLSKMISDIPAVYEKRCGELLEEREELEESLKDLTEDKEKRKSAERRKKDINTEIKNLLRQETARKYRGANEILLRQAADTKEAQEEYKKQRFWLEQIEHETEKKLLLHSSRELTANKLQTKWLFDTVWKDLTAYLASKFVDQGKAVYHFAMPDLHELTDGRERRLGEVLPRYRKGITSFDYERITAEERLERSMILAIMFAVNSYASAVCKETVYEEGKEDVLQLGGDYLTGHAYPDAERRLMQYFGGWSQWEEMPWLKELKTGEKEKLILELQKALCQIRNEAFHYAGARGEECLGADSVLVRIFKKERDGIGELIRKKYYSNNVPMFYAVKDIDKLMNQLYQEERVIESQIPSFQSVLGRKDMIDNMGGLIDRRSLSELQSDAEKTKIFYGSFYFLLKEIYYNSFLKEKDLKERFLRVLEGEKKELERKDAERRLPGTLQTRLKAVENLQSRIKEYDKDKKLGFGELCQGIMTDYNLQNFQKKVRTNRGNVQQEAKYEHFKMLLLKGLQMAFLSYIREEVMAAEKWRCGFLKNPKAQKNNVDEKEFCSGWKAALYEDLGKEEYDAWMISWFSAAHFMTPKHLNHLKGEIKGYLGYISGIEKRRALFTKTAGAALESLSERAEECVRLLKILDLASQYCGRVSAQWSDYYETEEAYADDIRKYLVCGEKQDSRSSSTCLREFCNKNEKNSPSGRIGIFYDGENPIVNRNVVRAKMYGTERLLEGCLSDDKITEKEIREYYKKSKELEQIFKSGECRNLEEEKRRRQYQQMKNRIELVDILRYSEIVNDLLSQLISWCYLRERDQMYFQIGLHYIRLYCGQNVVEEDSRYRVLRERGAAEGKGINISDGAVLYQLAAVFTYDLPIYYRDRDGYAQAAKSTRNGCQTSVGITAFWKEYCEKDASVYETGLELFQCGAEEKEIIEFRNYIDHNKYLARRDKSLLELYSQMYAKFFRHDTKFRKSVTVVLQNILARHFVLASLGLSYREEENAQRPRRIPQIEIERLRSEVTIHKFGEKDGGQNRGRAEKLDYYDGKFLQRLEKILSYKEK